MTELPKPLFKKPKLRANYSAAGLDREDGEELRRPVFGKRISNKKINNGGPYNSTGTSFFYLVLIFQTVEQSLLLSYTPINISLLRH